MSGDGRTDPDESSVYGQVSVRLRPLPLQVAVTVVAAVLLLLTTPGVSHAAVSVSRAEISGDMLRIEGTAAPNRSITVDGVAMGTSDEDGRFKVDRSGFTAPADCTVEVNDGSATAATAEVSGCTEPEPDPTGEQGSVSLSRGCSGPCGSGRVNSEPAGVDCTYTPDSTSGACGNVFFPAGTEVKLDARPAEGSKFLGWEFEVSCPDAPKVEIQADVAHICRPVFGVK
ncbi:MAG: hypothetical protein ACRDTM_08980 [Micromonosporaceae bacterium]